MTKQLTPFDPGSEQHQSEPYKVYEEYRRLPSVHAGIGTRGQNCFYLFAYDLVAAALKDSRLAHDAASLHETGGAPVPPQTGFFAIAQNFLISCDPPKHTRLRALVNQSFTPTIVESLRGFIENTADQLLDNCASHSSAFDLISEYSSPLSLLIIAAMLGLNVGNDLQADQFREWSEALATTMESQSPATIGRAVQAGDALCDSLRGVIERRRRKPEDDLISNLIGVEESGGGKLNEIEMLAICMMIVVAGHETTASLIGNGLLALLNNPLQLSCLRDEPQLARGAVEEMLRFDPPGRIAWRWAACDLKLGNTDIPRLSQVGLVVASANRDERKFADPDRFDISRDASGHLAFGLGSHFCLGAPLARLTGEIAFQKLLARFPALSLDTSHQLEWRESKSFRSLKKLLLHR